MSGALVTKDHYNNSDEFDICNALMPMEQRAAIACQMLMHLPGIANRLNDDIQEVKGLTHFLYQATDAAITSIHARISNQEITSQIGLSELYKACSNEFSNTSNQLRCNAESQQMLRQMIEKAQSDANLQMQTSEMVISKIVQLANAFETVRMSVSQVQQSCTQSIQASVDLKEYYNEQIAKATKAFIDNSSLFNKLAENWNALLKDTEAKIHSLDADGAAIKAEIERCKSSSQRNADKIASIEAAMTFVASAAATTELAASLSDLRVKNNVLEQKLARGGSIARGLETATERTLAVEDRLARLEKENLELRGLVSALSETATGRTLAAEDRLARLGKDNLELKGLVSALSERIATLEQRSPDPRRYSQHTFAELAPAGNVQVQVSDEDMSKLRREMDELRREVKASSQIRAESTSPFSAAAESAHAITYATTNAKTRDYIVTNNPTTLALFTEFGPTLAEMKPYGYPFSLHAEFSPFIVAVADRCRLGLEAVREECEAVSKQLFKPGTSRGDTFDDIIEGNSKQEIAELAIAMDRGRTKERRIEILSWFRRARYATIESPVAEWKEEASGKRALRAVLGKNPKTLTNVLNF